MFESDKKSPLDRLKKALYSRRQTINEPLRHDIHDSRDAVPESWQEEKTADGEIMSAISHTQKKVYKHLFIFSVAFFALAIVVGAYTFFGGRNFVSVDNIDILVEGPTSIAGGEPLNLGISVQNKNTTDIELVDLIVEYPTGSKDPLVSEKDLGRLRLSLGNIKSQSIVQKTLTSLMFGAEGEEKSVKFTAEYRTADSNAIFYKEKVYKVTISSSPVLVSIDALDKVFGNQSTDISITVNSNTKTIIKNLLLSLDYPFGFSVISSNPVSTYGKNIWRIGDLAPGAKKVITMKATTDGQDGEERTVHANVGIQSQLNEREIATSIISRAHTFRIERPFLGLDLTFDGNRSDLATEAGKNVRAEILWINNSQNKITNTRISAKLSGVVLDKNSVSVSDGGFYDSLTNTITWEAGRSSGLDSIAPGSDGRLNFGFRSTDASNNQPISNPIITVAVSGRGDRIDDSGAPALVESGISRSVKLVSNLVLSARALRSGGPFQNTGPIPPKAEQATTYTIVWTVTNTSNVVIGTRVSASLPAYMTWTGKISPEDANISYNPIGGIITWQVGEMPRNADIGSGAKQAAFQVSLQPSVGQVGEVPQILSEAEITGVDVFTGATLENSAPTLSTRTTTDLLWKSGNEIVQP
ncbi:MAG TPA: hypothetical protein VJH25_00135 [Candidatus Paceibacterota bacterium]